jgi:hypothetical protein
MVEVEPTALAFASVRFVHLVSFLTWLSPLSAAIGVGKRSATRL